MNILEITEKVQNGTIKAIETSQGWTLGALKSTASAFDTFRPTPARIPFAEHLPTPAETVDTSFAFVGRLLEVQHGFLTSLVDLSTPPAPTAVAAVKKA